MVRIGYRKSERVYHTVCFEAQIETLRKTLRDANEYRTEDPSKALDAKNILMGMCMSENTVRTDINKIGMDFFTRLGWRRYEINQKFFNILAERSQLASLMDLKEIITKLSNRGILTITRIETALLRDRLIKIGSHNTLIRSDCLSRPTMLARECSYPSIQGHMNYIISEKGKVLTGDPVSTDSEDLVCDENYQTFVSLSDCWDWLFDRTLVGAGALLIDEELPDFVDFTLLGRVLGVACRYLFVDQYGWDTVVALDSLAVYAQKYPSRIIPWEVVENEIFSGRTEHLQRLLSTRFSKGVFSPIEIIPDKGIRVKEPLIIWRERHRELARVMFEERTREEV